MFIRLPNLTQISLWATEIWPKNKIQDGGRGDVKISTNAILGPVALHRQYDAADQICYKSAKKWPRPVADPGGPGGHAPRWRPEKFFSQYINIITKPTAYDLSLIHI